jgi:hypothetical protein
LAAGHGALADGTFYGDRIMNRRQGLSIARRPGGAALLTAGLLAASAGAFAVPITSDLTITGSVALSTTIGVSPFSDGNVTQSGNVRTTAGGTTTMAAFSTSPGTADGADDASTTLPAPNPLTGTLTDTGDGIGWSTDLDALFATGFNFNEGYDFIIDFGMSMANASLVDTYTVTVEVDYSNAVDADGPDAFAVAGLDVERNNVDVLLSDVTSDTLLGDELNNTPTGTFGDPISDSGVFTFDVFIAPGALLADAVGGTHQWEGGVFDDPGASLADVSVDITILDVICSSGPCGAPPQPTPEPGALALLGLALPALALARRRRARTARAAD